MGADNSVERAIKSSTDNAIVVSDLGGSLERPNKAILLGTRGSQASIEESDPNSSQVQFVYRSRISPLKGLTHKEDISDISRKHNITMNGHIGHGRNLTQSTNFSTQGMVQPHQKMAGWGTDKLHLRQGAELHRIRAMPVEKQYHKKYWVR